MLTADDIAAINLGAASIMTWWLSTIIVKPVFAFMQGTQFGYVSVVAGEIAPWFFRFPVRDSEVRLL